MRDLGVQLQRACGERKTVGEPRVRASSRCRSLWRRESHSDPRKGHQWRDAVNLKAGQPNSASRRERGRRFRPGHW